MRVHGHVAIAKRGRGTTAAREEGRGFDVPGAALLNLGNVELQKVIQPLHEFLSAVICAQVS